MNDILKPEATWTDAVRALWPPESGKRLLIPKHQIAHPTAVHGMTRTVGLPEGQVGDYRLQLAPTQAGLHVREFQEHYEAMLAVIDLSVKAFDYLAKAPSSVGAAATFGAIIGAAVGRSGGAAAAGAVIGGLLASLAESVDAEALPEPDEN